MSLRPSVSVVLTVHDRPKDVLARVGASLLDQGAEETICVLDRSPVGIIGEMMKGPRCRGSLRYFGDSISRYVELTGPPGWRCPSAAWNVGFRAATGDLLYCLSSDVIQAPGNIEKARRFLSEVDAVLFGRCVESDQDRAAQDPTTTPILCSADAPRPLGFIMALPRWAVEKVGGYDEAFMGGQWQEDKDFTWRLWDLGLHFAFWDEVSGLHQTHDRGFLDSALIEKNRRVFFRKWGRIDRDLGEEARVVRPESGLTIWVNPAHAQRAGRREVA